MIFGTHVLIYTPDPEADRAFFRDVLNFRSVDIGHGWIIFKLPPSELALHPGDVQFAQRHAGHMTPGGLVFLMCDEPEAKMADLPKKNVVCTEVQTANWGIRTKIKMPS